MTKKNTRKQIILIKSSPLRYRTMKTTKELSDALYKIQQDAIKLIKSYFKRKSYERITFIPIGISGDVRVDIDSTRYQVHEINKEGYILVTGVKPKKGDYNTVSLEDLSADSLLTILDELERMKYNNQLKKP